MFQIEKLEIACVHLSQHEANKMAIAIQQCQNLSVLALYLSLDKGDATAAHQHNSSAMPFLSILTKLNRSALKKV